MLQDDAFHTLPRRKNDANLITIGCKEPDNILVITDKLVHSTRTKCSVTQTSTLDHHCLPSTQASSFLPNREQAHSSALPESSKLMLHGCARSISISEGQQR